MSKLFALADCNNFYASCERVFNPSLRGKPVVVLSNNDGCVIARSNEAKAVGIEMGIPIFKCQDLVARHNVQVLSANFVLYGCMSDRVMNTLAQYTSALDIYSIDEAFLELNGLNEDPYKYIQSIRERVRRDTGMPISIGIASTKTLAKLANLIAKKHCPEGVFCLIEQKGIDHWLEKTLVGQVWGIGAQKTEWLKRQGIENALQLRNMPDEWIKKNLTVVSLKTVWELRGTSCLPLEDIQPDKKAIGTSRTFGCEVSSLEDVSEAIAAYIGKAAEKLREQKSVCGYVQVFLETNRFKEGRFYSNSAGVDITPPTAHTPELITAAKKLVERVYRPGYHYKRAGVLLTNLQQEATPQEYLFDEIYHNSRSQRLMKIVDGYNRTANHGKIFMAAEGVHQPWYMKQAHRSKRFTTRWDELLEIAI